MFSYTSCSSYSWSEVIEKSTLNLSHYTNLILINPLCLRYHTTLAIFYCVKSVKIRSYFWSVFSCIRIEYKKIRTRNNSVFGHFSCSVYVYDLVITITNFWNKLWEKKTVELQHSIREQIDWYLAKKLTKFGYDGEN